MTQHYFENDLVKLHYYKFGNGPKVMLCFHGYGMHGKQFKILTDSLGDSYTFYGFDLFFHKQTKLIHQSLETIKKGISKQAFAALIVDFCRYERIDRFSVIGYSMGTHYATVVAEELPGRINEYIVVAPACLKPGVLVTFFSSNKSGNKILEKLTLSEKALTTMLKLIKRLRVVDEVGYQILHNEIATAELRFSFYACFTYLRFFGTDESKLASALNDQTIKSIFIFGKRDGMYPHKIGKTLIAKVKKAEVIVLDENHEMINQNFARTITALLT